MEYPFENFEDFDHHESYQRYERALSNENTRNIIIDFDHDTSFAALNVDCAHVEKLLQDQVR